jgi:hypothetical protein
MIFGSVDNAFSFHGFCASHVYGGHYENFGECERLAGLGSDAKHG